MAALAAVTASCTARFMWPECTVSVRVRIKVSTATVLAMLPPATPPMPSHTTATA